MTAFGELPPPPPPPPVGAFCLLRGGDIMRYQGPYGRHLAFCLPSGQLAERSIAMGAWAVLRVLTPADLPMLRTRRTQALARNLPLEAAETEVVIRELETT